MKPKIIPWDERSKLPASSGKGEINTDLIGHLELLKQELADCKKANRKSINLKNELTLLLMECGGQHLTPEDEALINSLYKEYLEASSEHQSNATDNLIAKRDERSEIIWENNQDLKHKSKRQQAQIILNAWKERGDGEDKPSYKTIIRWLGIWDKSQSD